MRMKVHNKGQVVLPVSVREALGISIGDLLDVRVDLEDQRIELKKCPSSVSGELAGSLRRYARGKAFPSRQEMHRNLRQGLSRRA